MKVEDLISWLERFPQYANVFAYEGPTGENWIEVDRGMVGTNMSNGRICTDVKRPDASR